MMPLITPRLILRRWRPDDRAPFAALCADPEVMRHFPAPLSRADSDALADRIDAAITERGFGFWAVEVRSGPSFIGFVGLSQPSFRPEIEVGWRLVRAAWGQGYATEAARAALAFGFGSLGLDQIISFTVPDNHRSRAVMVRLGMRHDPGDDFDHPALPPGHPLRRHVLYRLHRKDGPALPLPL